ncbi:MAG TPA: hypothetical protein VH062_10785 [Polyangiaceae bacterium]|nr:hypothetical protein [Polyangiaceae bacterium]
MSAPCITILAAGLADPVALAADADNLYVADDERQSIVALPLGGGTGRVIAAGVRPGPLATDDTRVYYVDNGSQVGDASVISIGKDGGEPSALVSGATDFVALAVYGGAVYIASALEGTVTRVATAGGPPSTLSSGNGLIAALAADESGVYFTDFGKGQVNKLPGGGGDAVVLADGEEGPLAIAVDGKEVYFTNPGEGTVKAVSEAGGAVRTLASGRVGPQALAVDTSRIYVVENAGSAEGDISAIAKKGGAPVTLVGGQRDATAITMRGNHIYWVKRNEETMSGTRATALELEVESEVTAAGPAAECPRDASAPAVAFADGGFPGCAASCTGQCNGSRCIEPVVTATASQQFIFSLAADSSALYWTSAGPTGKVDTLAMAPLQGGAPEVLAMGSPLGFTVVGGSVYWLDGVERTLNQVPISGGDSRVLYRRDIVPDGLVTDGANLFWFENGPSSSTVMKVSLSGGEPTALVTAPMTVAALAVDMSQLYFVDRVAGVVGSIPVTGGAVTTLVTTDGLSPVLASDGTYLYFATVRAQDPDAVTNDGKIQRVLVHGGTPTVLVSALGDFSNLLLDPPNLFFGSANAIGRLPAGGGPVSIFSGVSGTIALAGGALYAGDFQGRIVRVTPE